MSMALVRETRTVYMKYNKVRKTLHDVLNCGLDS
jgi:hypothetical protein